MKLSKLLVLSLLFVFIISNLSLAAPYTLKFDQIITAGGRTMPSKVWVKNKKVRMETSIEGHEMITVIKDNKYFNYTPAAKIATVINMQDDVIATEANNYPKNYLAFLKEKGAKYGGSAVVDGKPTQIYQYTNEDGTNVKVWVWVKKNFPLKMTFLHGNDRRSIIRWKNVKFNIPIPDKMFEFAPGTRIIDMTQGMPGI